MRNAYLALSVALLGSHALAAAPSTAAQIRVQPEKVVHLDDVGALALLKATNPDHYARVRGIMAAADHLCRPGPPNVFYARYQARDIACPRFQVLTSFPPKRRLSFKLDDTRYIATIVISDHPGRIEPAR